MVNKSRRPILLLLFYEDVFVKQFQHKEKNQFMKLPAVWPRLSQFEIQNARNSQRSVNDWI